MKEAEVTQGLLPAGPDMVEGGFQGKMSWASVIITPAALHGIRDQYPPEAAAEAG